MTELVCLFVFGWCGRGCLGMSVLVDEESGLSVSFLEAHETGLIQPDRVSLIQPFPIGF